VASEPITQEQRREWRALAEQAHEGTKRQPWVAVDCPYEGRWIRAEFPDYGDVRVARNVHTSAHRYIAHSSPDRVLALLAAYDAVTAERDRLLQALDAVAGLVESMGLHAYDAATGHYVVSGTWLGEVEDIIDAALAAQFCEEANRGE
jgi:hypothetical protein